MQVIYGCTGPLSLWSSLQRVQRYLFMKLCTRLENRARNTFIRYERQHDLRIGPPRFRRHSLVMITCISSFLFSDGLDLAVRILVMHRLDVIIKPFKQQSNIYQTIWDHNLCTQKMISLKYQWLPSDNLGPVLLQESGDSSRIRPLPSFSQNLWPSFVLQSQLIRP